MMQVLAHDPEVTELNMSIFTSPAQSGILSGSAAEVKQLKISYAYPRRLRFHSLYDFEAVDVEGYML